jgi:hypothetical protein
MADEPSEPTELEVLRSMWRVLAERYFRLASRTTAIERLLVEKGFLTLDDISARETQLVDESITDAEKAMREEAQEEILRKLESHKGPVQ